MEQNSTTNPNAGKGLGIAGLIVGIVALLFSFIPCLGMWAIVPAIVGLIMSAISMKQAGAAGAPKGMAIGGLICSILGLLIALYWIYLLYFGASQVMNELEKTGALDSLKNAMDRMPGAMDSLNKAMEQLKEVTDTLKVH